MQEVPPAEPVEEGDEGVWHTVGEPARSRSPAPTVEELLAQLERQPPAPEDSIGPVAAAVGEVVASGAQETSAPAAAAVEGVDSKEVDEQSNFIAEEVHLGGQGRSYKVVAWTRRPLTAE
jgi:hypothetical protein